MLRLFLGLRKRDKVRNERMRGTLKMDMFVQNTRQSRLRWCGHVKRRDDEYVGRKVLETQLFGQKVRQSRLRWCGHAKRRDDDYVGRKVLDMQLPWKRKRERPKMRYLDVVKEDMWEVGARDYEVFN